MTIFKNSRAHGCNTFTKPKPVNKFLGRHFAPLKSRFACLVCELLELDRGRSGLNVNGSGRWSGRQTRRNMKI